MLGSSWRSRALVACAATLGAVTGFTLVDGSVAGAQGPAVGPPGPASYLSFPVAGLGPGEAPAGATVPLWSRSIVSPVNKTKYTFTMVGTNPFVKETSPSVSVNTDLVPVKIEFMNTGGTVAYTFSAGATNVACGLAKSPDALTLGSPLFKPYDANVDGTSIGNVQYEDGFMRENFAKYVLDNGAINPGYGITLAAHNHPVVTVKVPAADWAVYLASTDGQCGGSPKGNMGSMNINWWGPYVQSTLIPALQSEGVTKSTDMLSLLIANVVMYQGSVSQCCVLGYHSGIATGQGVQDYATSDYDSTGLFTGGGSVVDDVGGMSHELGEWLNDPNGNNPVPAWGHIGQQPNCQANLEVGDPLSGTVVPITMPNGVTYHPQELVFFSWFYRQSPSIGLGGWYSSNGTFTKSAGAIC